MRPTSSQKALFLLSKNSMDLNKEIENYKGWELNFTPKNPKYRIELDDCTLNVFNEGGTVIKSQTFDESQLAIILGREYRENIEYIRLSDWDLEFYFY